MKRPTTGPIVGLLVVILIWGGNFTFSKLAFRDLPPLTFTAIRFTVASALLLLILFWREGVRLPPRKTWPTLIVLGLLGNTLYQLVFINGLARTSATNSSLILASMPTVVTVWAGLLGLERTTTRERIALAVATLGVVLVVGSRGLDFGGERVGDLLMLCSVVAWASYTVFLRRFGQRLSVLSVTAWTSVTGTPVLLLAGLPGVVRLNVNSVSAIAWLGLLYATFLSLVVAYFLWNRGIQVLGASRTALFTCLTPLAATSIAMMVLHERPGVWHFVGGALIVAGVLLSQAKGRNRKA